MNRNRVLNRRRFLGLTGLAGTGALIAACAPQAAAPAAPAAPAAEATSAPAEAPVTEAPAEAAVEPTAVINRIGESYDESAVNFWTPGGSAAYLGPEDTLTGEDVLPEFSVRVGDLFPPVSE